MSDRLSSRTRLGAAAAVATLTATAALDPLFTGGGWFVPVTGAVLLVSAASGLVRRSPLPAALEPLTAATAVLCWLTFLYARPVAPLGIVPGRAALRVLDAVARSGTDDVRRLATPVPTHQGLVLLAVCGASAVALVVDLLVVTVRRAALAGVPVLVLFAVCAGASRHGIGVVPFVVAASGFLWLLHVDSRERVRRWAGSAPAATAPDVPHTRAMHAETPVVPGTLGRRIGSAAVGLSVVVPVLLPGLHAGVHHGGSGGGSSARGGNVVTVNPIVSIASDLTRSGTTPVLRYRTSTAAPGYLRLTSLDEFDGTTFSAPTLIAPPSARVDHPLPVTPATGLPVTTTLEATSALDVHWLPVPTPVVAVSVAGDWRYDRPSATVFSASAATPGLHYDTTSVAVDPTPAALAAAGPPDKALAADLSLTGVPTAVRTLTKQWTAGTRSQYAAALAIQQHLTGPLFSYDTHIPADDSPSALARFLLNTRRGFCQQFATAMAVMARLHGIPSRVAVGFTRGLRQPDGSWLVTTHDAHAWPELWFAGYGWLPFEPTPRGDGQAVGPAYTRVAASTTALPHLSDGGGSTGRSGQVSPAPAPAKATRDFGAAGAGQHPTVAAARHGRSSLAGLRWLVLLLLVVPAAARLVVRRRRALGVRAGRTTEPAWQEVADTAVDLGLPWPSGRSPRETAARLAAGAELGGEPATALRRLATVEERRRYAPAPLLGDPALWHDVAAVSAALRRGSSTRVRLRAAVAPRSVLRPGRWAGRRLPAGYAAARTRLAALTPRRRRLPGAA